MSRFTDWIPAYAGMTLLYVATTLLLLVAPAQAGAQFPGVGRPATPDEIRAWDIDVRPDFKGLPPGSGSVAKGQEVWEGKCASCHGVFGESNDVFPPLVGGTTAEDIRNGRTKSLAAADQQRTTLMKLSSISTLWDYVRRAMPWDKPKSLSTEEVYAVVAYLLHLGEIVPVDFVLSNTNMAEVQGRLPNRNGMTRDHGLWDLRGRPDTKNAACMKDCATEVKVASAMPEHAKESHGKPAEQNRLVGPGVIGATKAVSPKGETVPPAGQNVAELARSKSCLACHSVDKRVVGPAFREIAARYKGQEGAETRLVEKLRKGGGGTWGAVPMPANPDLAEADARALVRWILGSL